MKNKELMFEEALLNTVILIKLGYEKNKTLRKCAFESGIKSQKTLKKFLNWANKMIDNNEV